ncbi:hypothetical protein ACHAWF_002304 [Thalassiosira exigua]
MTIPTVSLDSPREDVAKALRDACARGDFFYLEGHGVPESLLDKVLEQSKKLFDLPTNEKESIFDPILQRGYTRFESETLDPKNQSRGDTKEGFYIGEEAPQEETDAAKLHGPNVWPQTAGCALSQDQCNEFRETLEQYRAEARRAALKLVRCFALAIGQSDPFLLDKYFTQSRSFIRLLHYSAEPSDEKNGLFACGAHSDYGMLTLLLTDENPGLQVKRDDGTWIDIPPKRGSFVVNVGDMFERWTNGLFRSTVHRVITPQGAGDRYSVPFFFDPNFDALVECLESCCSDKNPPKYPPITAGQHLLNMYGKTYADFDNTEEGKK